MLFLDQPASGVGFSYSEEGVINNTPTAAKDVYAFLQLFLDQFPKYSKLPFHIAGESYGGVYLPNFAAEIHNQNKALEAREEAGVSLSSTEPIKINLESIAIGNGLTNPAVQFPSVFDYACGEENKYRLFDPSSDTCNTLASKAATCKKLIEQCYKFDSTFTCTPAALYCWSGLYQPLQATGLNLYDVRKTCDRAPEKDGPLCYPQLEQIEKFMNKQEIRSELGIPDQVQFTTCNMQVNQAFLLHGDSMHDASALLIPLINDGIRTLIYAGETDAMCNWIGNRDWVQQLNTTYADIYADAPTETWYSSEGKRAGTVRSAAAPAHKSSKKHNKAFGNLAFVKVEKAGHMVPSRGDQPVASLDMFNRWISNEQLDVK